MSAWTIAFFPEGAYGPTNNCIGIADVLRRKGHRVVFVQEPSFAGTFEAHGFEERLVELAPPPEVPEAPGQFWKDFIAETAPVFRRPTVEQLDGMVAPTFRALVDGSIHVDEQLRAVLDDVRPDVVVEDNVVAFPAIEACGAPWVRIVSCQPAELPDPRVPPAFSGLPTDDDADWAAFRAHADEVLGPIHAELDEHCRARGGSALAPGEWLPRTADLGLWLYPEELDYVRERPLGPAWHRLESCVRTTDAPWSPPPQLAEGEGPLVYLSLGSLGAGDVPLMQGLIDALDDAPMRVVVSLGPQHEALRLPPTMAGAELLPQASLLGQVDVVVTHGGNNTVTEAMAAGKPMVVLPLFWDQHDNAQRVAETGFGVRLPTYDHAPEQLREAILGLHADAALRARLDAASRRIAARPGTQRAAGLIASLALRGRG